MCGSFPEFFKGTGILNMAYSFQGILFCPMKRFQNIKLGQNKMITFYNGRKHFYTSKKENMKL